VSGEAKLPQAATAEKAMNWSVEETGSTVQTIRIAMDRNKNWEQWMLVTADRHLDNPHSNRAMQKRHLDQAVERGAFVCDFGDLFCAMQGRNDRRSSKSDLAGEHKVEDYYDEIVRGALGFFEPYRDNLAIFGTGNHETAILRHMESNLTRRLVERLQNKGSQIVLGGYRGWIRLMFSGPKGQRKAFNIAYTHGSGGAAPVTKGVIKTNRRSVVFPDADIQLSGHIHEGWSFPIARIRLSDQGREYKDEQVHLCIPTYKDEITDQGGGWAVEGEHSPKPIGAWWLRFFWDRSESRVRFEYTRAA
jgi:hypothetical protein